MKHLDSTIVNIVTILVGGAGIFTVLTEFNVPGLHLGFLDGNPFSMKRASIESAQTWIFTLLTICALILQLWAQIWGGELTKRRHDSATYLRVSVCGLVMLGCLVWALSHVGYLLARRDWQPIIVSSQRPAFEQATFVASHDGWTVEHLRQREQIVREGNEETYKRGNVAYAERNIAVIEELLEVDARGTLVERVDALAPFFAAPPPQ